MGPEASLRLTNRLPTCGANSAPQTKKRAKVQQKFDICKKLSKKITFYSFLWTIHKIYLTNLHISKKGSTFAPQRFNKTTTAELCSVKKRVVTY